MAISSRNAGILLLASGALLGVSGCETTAPAVKATTQLKSERDCVVHNGKVKASCVKPKSKKKTTRFSQYSR
jgi:hypothetical protein